MARAEKEGNESNLVSYWSARDDQYTLFIEETLPLVKRIMATLVHVPRTLFMFHYFLLNKTLCSLKINDILFCIFTFTTSYTCSFFSTWVSLKTYLPECVLYPMYTLHPSVTHNIKRFYELLLHCAICNPWR